MQQTSSHLLITYSYLTTAQTPLTISTPIYNHIQYPAMWEMSLHLDHKKFLRINERDFQELEIDLLHPYPAFQSMVSASHFTFVCQFPLE